MAKSFLYVCLLVLLIPLWSAPCYAWQEDTLQTWSSLREKVLPVGDTLILDTLTIDPASLVIEGHAAADFQLLPGTGTLVRISGTDTDSVRVRYRVFPFSLTAVQQHKSLGSLLDTNIAFPYYSLTGADTADDHFVRFNSLRYQGSYGRSLSLGNQQDLSMNSKFNLQLDGYILDSVRVEAALTDNNIPVQPEGNTRQIQEFDRIFVSFSKGQHKLTAGDYQISRPDAYFLNFDKRVQGLQFETAIPYTDKVQNKLTVSGSIAKGQFARNVFMGQEGNQGPYKLTGNNGEQFFIILAGSEKVYMDGMLLERGEDRDYTINYNTAEISFMPRRMVTRERRIQVEFEYQDRNYLNTLFYLKDELKIGDKWAFKINAYSNQDARNQPYLQTLNAAQKQFLSGIGDDIDQAFYRNIVADTFAADKILYKMVDTTVNGLIYDSVFVYSTHPDSARYTLSFSYVGEGKGNYMISGMNTNGRSYAWLAPVDGVPQGSYEPVILLITPKMHQLFSTAGTYHIDTAQQVFLELAASNYAPNLFSDRDKAQHWGYAGKGGYEGKVYLGKADTAGRHDWVWSNRATYEWVQHRFRAVAPFRNVEFSRDWNLQLEDSMQQPDDHFLQFKTALSWKQRIELGYDYSFYRKGMHYSGNRNIISLDYAYDNIRAGGKFNVLHTDNQLMNTRFLRPDAFIERTFKQLAGITLGAQFEQEKNELVLPTGDLQVGSFAFDRYALYLNREEHDAVNFSLRYEYRTDDSVGTDELTPYSKSHNAEGRLELTGMSGQQLSLTAAYRNLLLEQPGAATESSGEKVLGRLEYNGSLWGRFIVPALLYEIGSGQEQKLEQVYIEVPAGQGQYMWVDYNEDGVQQANEFEIGLYPDQKKYMLIITPTQDYQRVNYVILTHSLNINPEFLYADVGNKNSWQKFISRFSNQFTLQVNNKVLASEGMAGFNPFARTIADASIISNMTSANNTFFFNRKSARWGLDYNYGFHSGKSLLTYGLESQLRQKQRFKARWNFVRNLTAVLQGGAGRMMHVSAMQDGRSYRIDNRSLHPELVWLKPSVFRITGGYEWDQRENTVFYGGEQALIQRIMLELRFTFPSLGILQGRGTYADIRYSGEENTPVAFTIMESLQPGTNWLWYLNWERRIGKGLEISLEYEGRKPGGQAAVHTGRMSIRAIL